MMFSLEWIRCNHIKLNLIATTILLNAILQGKHHEEGVIMEVFSVTRLERIFKEPLLKPLFFVA